MMLSEANDIGLALIIGASVFWVVNVCLRLAGRRLYWLTFWTLFIGLPALAIRWFSTPVRTDQGSNFGDGIPREWALGAAAVVLWAAVMILELIVFIALKIRDHRRARALQSAAGGGDQ
jgi:hypothetical protein